MIGFDATNNSHVNSTGMTFSHTCSGANRLLLVAIGNSTGTVNVGTVTYNGVTMTLLDYNNNGGLWGLLAPTLGANNIVVSGYASQLITAVSASYTGVLQYNLPDNHTAKGVIAGSSSVSQSITPNNPSCWVIGMISQQSSALISAGANTTVRGQNDNDRTVALADANATIWTPTLTTLNYNSGSTGFWDMVAISVQQAPDGGAFLQNFV